MQYQRTGILTSLLVHTALFALVFGVSRLLTSPSGPFVLDIGILTSSTVAPSKAALKKNVHRKPEAPPEKSTIKQQEAPSETAVAEKAVARQEQTASETSANSATTENEPGSGDKGSDTIGPVFDADYLHNPKPAYPPIARRLKLEGTVIVQVLVSAAGKPAIVRLGKSSGSSVLDQAALTAVQSWSFIPARQGGEPVPAWVDIPIRFHLV
jgi:protein TonB